MTDSSSTNRRKPTDDQITHQCNLIHACEHHGYKHDGSVRDLAVEILQGNILPEHPVSIAISKHANTIEVFKKHLIKTLEPMLYGLSRSWRKTQDELLRTTINTISRGYIRPLSEVPTGSGKSMFIGALVRAALDTMKELGLDQEIHIITSRIAIAGQLIYEELPEEEKGDRPLELGKTGDVRIWCPELSDEKIRLLAGSRGSIEKEIGENSVITVSTYQGLRAERITNHFKKPAFITICDESHRVTERVAILLEQMRCMTFGLSATVLGPERDPFFFFERIVRPEFDTEKKKTYVDFLCYHKSIVEMIKDQELKPVRWINARSIKINVSDAQLRSGKGIYDVFNDASVSKILSKNPELGAEAIAEAYLGRHDGLTLSGSKPVYKRRGIAFVDRINTAKVCAETCNNILPEKLKEQYGESVYFNAGYVDGTMSEGEYNKIVSDFRTGKITLLFSAEKIGEGVDFPFVDLIIPLRVLGFGSQWKLVQNLGRGLRVDPAEPLSDLVVLDMVFVSDRHLLASVLGIFGRSSLISGGLIAGWHSNYELEQKVFHLLQKGRSWTEVWGLMTAEERKHFPFIESKMIEEKMRQHSNAGVNIGLRYSGENIFKLDSIEFIERDDIRFAMSLGNQNEIVKYTMEILIEEKFDSIERLQSLQNFSLNMFAKRRFGQFRDGLTMVNLNLQEEKSQLNASNMTAFIELMRKAGMQERRKTIMPPDLLQRNVEVVRKRAPEKDEPTGKKMVPKSKKIDAPKPVEIDENSIGSLISAMQNRFGLEPEISSMAKDLYGKPAFFIAQAAITLPEGLKYTSDVRRSRSEDIARKEAAAELFDIVTKKMKEKEVTLYRGSEWYENLIKVTTLIVSDLKYSDPYFTTTNRNGIYVVQACTEKYKMEIKGAPAVNKNEELSRAHALMFLGLSITKTLPSYRGAADVMPQTVFIEKLNQLCEQLKTKVHSNTRKIETRKDFPLYESTLGAIGIKVSAMGITPEHAKERAALELSARLMEFIGGRTEN